MQSITKAELQVRRPLGFGLYKRDGKVYTEIVTSATVHTPQRIIIGCADIDSVIHSYGWYGYDELVECGYDKHFSINYFNLLFKCLKNFLSANSYKYDTP